MKKEYIFQSGDDKGADVSCYNCGKRFSDSLDDKLPAERMADIESGSVVCTCGQRLAYIVDDCQKVV